MKDRVQGFDIARALAVFGMVIVNFKIAQEATSGSAWMLQFAGIFEGRASALFVILAGVGVSFVTRKALSTGDPSLVHAARLSLIKRGLLLVVLGLAFTPIWPADILHFYGFYFLVAAWVFPCSHRSLLGLVVVIAYAFPVLMFVVDYGKGWDWNTLEYHGFWTLDGMVRHILFNGFHPVIPWCSYLLFGLWLGRQDLSAGVQRTRLFVTAFVLWLATESVFNWFRHVFFNPVDWDMSAEDIGFLFSTEIIPPMPQYLLAAGSMAVMVIIACLFISERFAGNRCLQALYQTGQLALTLYVLHVLLGMGLMEAAGMLGGQSIGVSLLWSLGYCIFAVAFSVLWFRYFKQGPLEWGFRRLVAKG